MDVAKLYAKAEETLKKKNYDFTIEILKNQILPVYPDDVKARKLLRGTELEKLKIPGNLPSKGQLIVASILPRIKMAIYKMLKKWDLVMQEAENILVNDPRNVDVLFMLGEAALNGGYENTAIHVLESTLGVDPNHIECLKMLGRLYRDRNELEKAQRYFHKAYKLNPKDIEASREMKAVAAARTAKDYGKAKSSRDVIKDKDLAEDLALDTQKLRTEEDFQRAIARWKREIDKDPNNRKALRELGAVYQKHEEYDKAIEVYERVLELDPTSFDIRCRIGDCRIAEFDLKIRELREKAKTDPAAKQRILKLQRAKLQAEIQDYTERVNAQPTNYDLRFKLGFALFQNAEYHDAIAHFQQAVKDPRRKADAYNFMGQCFMHQGKADLAAKQFEKGLAGLSSKSEKYRRILYNLGDAYEKKGDKEKALETFTKIYEIDINYKDVTQRIDKLQG